MVEWGWLVVVAAISCVVGFGLADRRSFRRWVSNLTISGVFVVSAATVAVAIAASLIVAVVVVLAGNLTIDALSKLGPVATALTAVAAVVIGTATVWQKTATDREDHAQKALFDSREQWWKRTEWALGWAFPDTESTGGREAVGTAALYFQQDSSLAGIEELNFINAALAGIAESLSADVTETVSADVVLGGDGETDVDFYLSEHGEVGQPAVPEAPQSAQSNPGGRS